MHPRTPVSVCIATYNGMPYLLHQLESILSEVTSRDQIVLIDDASQDDSFAEAKALLAGHDNAVVRRNASNQGHVPTFTKAFSLATNPIIVTSDQDDVWPQGRLDSLLQEFEAGSTLLAFGSLALFDPGTARVDTLTVRPKHLAGLRGLLRFIVERNASYGSASAFRRSAVDLSIPVLTETYEQWLVAQVLATGRVSYTDSVVTLRREHGANLTHRRSLPKRFRSRAAAVLRMLSTYLSRRRARR